MTHNVSKLSRLPRVPKALFNKTDFNVSLARFVPFCHGITICSGKGRTGRGKGGKCSVITVIRELS